MFKSPCYLSAEHKYGYSREPFSLDVCSLYVLFNRTFLLFSKHEPPAIINFIEKYIPPMVMISLLFYCLKDVSFASISGFFPQFIGVLITIFIHLWKHNSLLSIFSGTIIYMFFTKILY